jgi:hypothetical protein
LKVVDYNNWFNSGLSFATVLKIMSLGWKHGGISLFENVWNKESFVFMLFDKLVILYKMCKLHLIWECLTSHCMYYNTHYLNVGLDAVVIELLKCNVF